MNSNYEVTENIQKLKSEIDWSELVPTLCLLRQSRTKYLTHGEEIEQNWTRQQRDI